MIDGRIVSDFGVTSFPSFVTKMMFAPPVSSMYVCVSFIRNGGKHYLPDGAGAGHWLGG